MLDKETDKITLSRDVEFVNPPFLKKNRIEPLQANEKTEKKNSPKNTNVEIIMERYETIRENNSTRKTEKNGTKKA